MKIIVGNNVESKFIALATSEHFSPVLMLVTYTVKVIDIYF